MPRIRTIKPDFFTSLDMAKLSMEARLLFIGLWTHSDDEGRNQNEPRLIKAAIFPLDDQITAATVVDLMVELAGTGSIDLYRDNNGRPLYQVRAWKAHQKIDKPSTSKYPSPNDPGCLPDDSTNVRVGLATERKGKERTLAPEPTAEVKVLPNLIWDALAAHFGEPSTPSEKSNRGRQVKELTAAGATPADIDSRIREHKRRNARWTLTANALCTHWTELAPKPDNRRYDPDTGAYLSEFIK